ncbi:MAG TPA: transcriptional regulator [bacterium]|nr:transcriptional regulator [bacterium]HOL48589.1 transcriptional regulator [bacterium]HPQ18748.1 transcriptional regulator [bacterium]
MEFKTKADFEKARLKQYLNSIFSFITNKPNSLYSFEEINNIIKPKSQSYKGIQSVPIKNIIGSEGRYKDFDNLFLPKHSHTRDRWESIDSAYYKDIQLPPVSLYKINDYYFVKDGNHRVSVAREKGIEFIDAEVIELKLDFSFNSIEELKAKILEYEKDYFYNKTKLKEYRKDADINCSIIGNYEILLNHIDGHKYFLSEKRGIEVPYSEAVLSWYDNVYLPIIKLSKQEKIEKYFPDKTLSDLYIWFIDYWHRLKIDFGFSILPEIAISEYTQKYGKKQQTLLLQKIKEFFGID